MYYTLLYYPKFDKKTEKNVRSFREKYDPFVNSWKPHITLVFPIHSKQISKEELKNHIFKTLPKWKSFEINITGLEMSWDNWLFVLLGNGNKEVISLHDDLYCGILKPYLRKDIEFIPHIAIGLFNKKESHYDLRNPDKVELDKELSNKAFQEAKSLKINFADKIDGVFLETLNDSLNKILNSEEIAL